MSVIEKYYQRYILQLEIKKIVKKYAVPGQNIHRILIIIDRLIYLTQVFNQNARLVLHNYIRQELTSSFSLLKTDADTMISSILDCIYNFKPTGSSGKLIKKENGELIEFTYKDYTLPINKCYYEKLSNITSDEAIVADFMNNSIRANKPGSESTQILSDDEYDLLNSLIKKYNITNVYEISRSIRRLISPQLNQVKNKYIRSEVQDLMKDFGKSDGLLEPKYEDNSLIIVSYITVRLLRYYLENEIFTPILENNKNIIIYICHYDTEPWHLINNMYYPMTNYTEVTTYPSILFTDCTVSRDSRRLFMVRCISSKQDIIDNINKHYDEKSKNH
jgi:hypothetical protein